MHFITERLLVAKARRGNPQAFAKLYDAYVDQVYRFILFKVRRQEEAQDVASDTFLKVWRYLQEGGQIDSFKAFVYRVARNLVIDQYRKYHNSATVPLETSENLHAPSLEEDIKTRQELSELIEILFDLKDEWREIIILRYVEGFKISEIASILEKNEGAIRVLIHRAQKALKEKHPNYGEPERNKEN